MPQHVITRPIGAVSQTGSCAPPDASYLVVSSSATLENERVLIAGPGIKFIVDATSVTARVDRVCQEVPSGAIDGTNTVFTLQYAPDPPECLEVYRRGLMLMSGSLQTHDYMLSGSATLVMATPPQPDQPFFVNYFK